MSIYYESLTQRNRKECISIVRSVLGDSVRLLIAIEQAPLNVCTHWPVNKHVIDSLFSDLGEKCNG